ncbi:MAG: Rab family GTPase [Candidatus Heimdallarchaeaceae archaeon]
MSIERQQGKKYIFKIVLLGDPGVGKSSLISRYVHNRFESSYMITIGVDILSKQLFVGDDEVLFLISDIGGQERFSSVREKFYRGSKGCFLVFDLTRANTLESIREWKRGLDGVEDDVIFFVIGNKADLKDQIAVEEEEAIAIVNELNLPTDSFFITSAKTGEKVEEAFQTFARELIKAVEKKRVEVR